MVQSAMLIELMLLQRAMLQLGHRGAFETEVLSGLKQGDVVISHPTTEIEDGVRVTTGSFRQ